jgi:transmembrane sensor
LEDSTSFLPDELLARYLASRATRPEIERVQEWLEESPDHVQELKAYRQLWERSRAAGHRVSNRQTGQPTFDTDVAWRLMQSKMKAQGTESSSGDRLPIPLPATRPLPARRRYVPALWAAAAVVLLLIPWLRSYFTPSDLPQEVTVSTQKNTYEKTLPDGTKVFLNYNSTLTYPEGLRGDTRRVSLRGEAFFEVAPDAVHPFVIGANGTEIRVVGTSFNVKAYDEAVRVDVKTGKVEVRKAVKTVELLPGEGVEIQADTVFRKLSANLNTMAYRTQVFDFTATHLDEVVRSLSEGFHADVRLSKSQLARCRLTGRYERESLDATLAVIAETLNLTVSQRDGTYWLDGSGCQ